MLRRYEMKSFFILCCLFINTLGYAQVTIGSGNTPQKGTLLDLKQTDSLSVNSTKGLMLPRVNLTDIENLFPMFDTNDAMYNTPEKKKQEDIKHSGLVIYNINTVHPHICPGVYLWLENVWTRIPKPCFDPCTNFDVNMSGPSCAYTGKTLNFKSSLTGTTENIIVDRWTISKEGGTEQIIPSEKSADLAYEFPLLATEPGKYSFTVYYKHNSLDCEKSKTITTEIYESVLQDFWIGTVSSTNKTYEFKAKIYKRAPNDEFSTVELPLKVIKWSYVKAGTTTEVDMGNAGLNNITYSFKNSGSGKYYIKMTWEDFPCAEGLDPEPANNTPTPRRVLHPVVVGELNVQ